jgi:two-component system, sporulation sensor kinase B
MFAIVLLALWTIGILLILSDRHSLSSRWAGMTALIGGFGFLAGALDDELRPYMPQGLHPGIHAISNIASLVCQVGLPYAFLLYAVHTSPFVSAKKKGFISYLGFIPILYMVSTTQVFPDLVIDYRIMAIWALPYILFSAIYLFYLFFIEKDPLVKRSRFVMLVIGTFPMLFVMVTIYISRIFGWYDAWKFNTVAIFVQFILFIGFSLKYGVLGFKLRVEQNRMNTAMRALTSGTSILNHTIKNEVGKMQLLIFRLEKFAGEHPEMKADIEDLYKSTGHMLEMVQRIQGKIGDIELRESTHSIEELVQAAVGQVKPLIRNERIKIHVEHEKRVALFLDPIHFHEVLVNLLRNAIEAIPSEGIIQIRTYRIRKNITIMVEDNGKGIRKGNLPFIFEPFFSTKKHNASNFGLGLAYCYQVMRKQQGLIEIDSTEGLGTRVFLYYPHQRVREVQIERGVEQYAPNSCDDGGR